MDTMELLELINKISTDQGLEAEHERLFVLLVEVGDRYLAALDAEGSTTDRNLITVVQGLGEVLEARHDIEDSMFGPSYDPVPLRVRPDTLRGYTSWTSESEAELVKKALAGETTLGLANLFGRSRRAIEQRLRFLGLRQIGGSWRMAV